jgi:hypothetical protein
MIKEELIGLTVEEAKEKLKSEPTKSLRVLSYGKENIITADFKPNRIDVYVNEDGIIVE